MLETNAPAGPPPTISEYYRSQLVQKHQVNESWGSSGKAHYETLLDLLQTFQFKSVLDYGCGKGIVGQRFRADQANEKFCFKDVEFFEYDPGIPGKMDDRSRAELVLCTDVLEHIEPEFLEEVLADLAHRTLRAAFLVISCMPAYHRLPDGRNAHLIVQHPTWWVDRLLNYFDITQSDLIQNDMYLVVIPRRNS